MANVSVMCVALGVAKLAHATNARLGGGAGPCDSTLSAHVHTQYSNTVCTCSVVTDLEGTTSVGSFRTHLSEENSSCQSSLYAHI